MYQSRLNSQFGVQKSSGFHDPFGSFSRKYSVQENSGSPVVAVTGSASESVEADGAGAPARLKATPVTHAGTRTTPSAIPPFCHPLLSPPPFAFLPRAALFLSAPAAALSFHHLVTSDTLYLILHSLLHEVNLVSAKCTMFQRLLLIAVVLLMSGEWGKSPLISLSHSAGVSSVRRRWHSGTNTPGIIKALHLSQYLSEPKSNKPFPQLASSLISGGVLLGVRVSLCYR